MTLPKGKAKKELLEKMDKYIRTSYNDEEDTPTIAGLAVFLFVTKEEILFLECCVDEEISKAIKRVKNQIEHYYISRSALKKINNSTAHFYLNNAFNYSKGGETVQENGDFKLNITVENE